MIDPEEDIEELRRARERWVRATRIALIVAAALGIAAAMALAAWLNAPNV